MKRVRRSLENRLVFCADCDANRILGVSCSGSLICSDCGSENWMHIAIPLVARFKEYNEQEVSERVAVERYIKKLEKEEFFTSNSVLV
jgi:hypothetical protein